MQVSEELFGKCCLASRDKDSLIIREKTTRQIISFQCQLFCKTCLACLFICFLFIYCEKIPPPLKVKHFCIYRKVLPGYFFWVLNVSVWIHLLKSKMDLGGGGGTVLVVLGQTLPYLEPKLRTWEFKRLLNRVLCQETGRMRKRLHLIAKAGIHLV